MTSWPVHPRDEWVEVTAFGAPEPEYLRAQSHIATVVAEARAQYLAGGDVDTFEARIDQALAEAREAHAPALGVGS